MLALPGKDAHILQELDEYNRMDVCNLYDAAWAMPAEKCASSRHHDAMALEAGPSPDDYMLGLHVEPMVACLSARPQTLNR